MIENAFVQFHNAFDWENEWRVAKNENCSIKNITK